MVHWKYSDLENVYFWYDIFFVGIIVPLILELAVYHPCSIVVARHYLNKPRTSDAGGEVDHN